MSGQAQVQMANAIGRLDVPRALKLFADWTDRIAAGELPAANRRGRRASSATSSSRVWDWADPKAYLHDEISTDKRNPTVNANGLIYGSPEDSTDFFPVLDPRRTRRPQIKMPVRDPKTPTSKNNSDGAVALLGRRGDLGQPDQHAQSDDRREGPGLVHVARRGRRRIRTSASKGSDHPSAKLFPIEQSDAPPRRCTIRRPARSR